MARLGSVLGGGPSSVDILSDDVGDTVTYETASGPITMQSDPVLVENPQTVEKPTAPTAMLPPQVVQTVANNPITPTKILIWVGIAIALFGAAYFIWKKLNAATTNGFDDDEVDVPDCGCGK